MLKVKLSRTGKRGQPHYRIVVAEAKSKRDGKVVANLGYYDPLTEDGAVSLDEKQYQYWLGVGARPTSTVRNLAKKAETK
jgi:small subunit ribosomal protein S16